MSDIALGTGPSSDEIAAGFAQLKRVQLTQTICTIDRPNPRPGRRIPASFAGVVERTARRLFPTTWREHGLPGIRERPYSLDNFDTAGLTGRVLAERALQLDAKTVTLSNGCCDKKGCPTSVFQLAVLAAVWSLPQPGTLCDRCGETGRLKVCGGCRGVQYCSAACQKADWRQHRGQCRAAEPAEPAAPAAPSAPAVPIPDWYDEAHRTPAHERPIEFWNQLREKLASIIALRRATVGRADSSALVDAELRLLATIDAKCAEFPQTLPPAPVQ